MSETPSGDHETNQEAIDEAFWLLVHGIEVDFGGVSDPVTNGESNLRQDPFGVSDLMVRQTVEAPGAEQETRSHRVTRSDPVPLEYSEPPGSGPRPDKWTLGDQIVKTD